MFLISSTEKSTSESDFSVIKGKSDGNVLQLSKKEFLIKSNKRVFNNVQWQLGLVDGSDNFFEIFL